MKIANKYLFCASLIALFTKTMAIQQSVELPCQTPIFEGLTASDVFAITASSEPLPANSYAPSQANDNLRLLADLATQEIRAEEENLRRLQAEYNLKLLADLATKQCLAEDNLKRLAFLTDYLDCLYSGVLPLKPSPKDRDYELKLEMYNLAVSEYLLGLPNRANAQPLTQLDAYCIRLFKRSASANSSPIQASSPVEQVSDTSRRSPIMVPTFSSSPAETSHAPRLEANVEIVSHNKTQTVTVDSAGKEAVTSRAKRVAQKRTEKKLLTASKSVQKKDTDAAKRVSQKRKMRKASSSNPRREKVESTPVPLVCFPQVLTDRLRESEFAQKPQSTNSSQSKPVGIMRSLRKGLN